MKLNINKLLKYNLKKNIPLHPLGLRVPSLTNPKNILEKLRQLKSFK